MGAKPRIEHVDVKVGNKKVRFRVDVDRIPSYFTARIGSLNMDLFTDEDTWDCCMWFDDVSYYPSRAAKIHVEGKLAKSAQGAVTHAFRDLEKLLNVLAKVQHKARGV